MKFMGSSIESQRLALLCNAKILFPLIDWDMITKMEGNLDAWIIYSLSDGDSLVSTDGCQFNLLRVVKRRNLSYYE